MISKRHAELLKLSSDARPEEARERCESLLGPLRREMNQLPPGDPDWPRLEQRCQELEKALKELSETPGPATEIPERESERSGSNPGPGSVVADCKSDSTSP